jgi:hypothetical protein
MLSPDLDHPNTQVNTSIDKSSVVRQLQAFLLGYPPKREYPHDANILSHIRWLWSQQQKNWKSTTYYQFLPSTHCSHNTKEKR